MSLYETMVKLGVVTGHHYSDLYVRATSESVRAVRASGLAYSFFTDRVTGVPSIEIPLAYEPFFKLLRGKRNQN